MNPEELDRLIHRYFERDLTPAEEALLGALIRTDRAVADRFVELTEMESALVESLHAEEVAPPEVSTPMRTSRRRTQVLRTPAARPVWPLFFAAALMVGFVALLVRSVDKPVAPTVVVQAPEVRVEPPVLVKPGVPPIDPVAPRLPEPKPKPVDDLVSPLAGQKSAPVPPPRSPEPKPEEKREVVQAEKPVIPTDVKPLEARLEKIEGDVVRIADATTPVTTNQKLVSGQGLDVRKGLAVLLLEDGTRVELRPNTRLDKMVLSVEQKRFEVSRGAAASSVAKQPAKTSVVFLTPQSELQVIGTRLSFEIANEVTRLDVQEGHVKMIRRSDKASVDVFAGHYALAGKGAPPKERIAPVVRAFQDSVFPTPDYAGTRDTWISSAEPNQNFAKGDLLRLGRLSAGLTTLISWDVKSIPAGSRVSSVELSFWVTGKIVGNCKVYDLRQPFNESEATWRLATSATAWRQQGAAHDGSDRGQVIGLLAPAGPVAMYTMPLNEWGVAALQEAVNTGKANFGILILGPDANEWNLDSRESVTPERRPKLTVTYLPAR